MGLDYTRTDPPLVDRVLQRILWAHGGIMARFVAPTAEIALPWGIVIPWVKDCWASLRHMARNVTALAQVLAA